MNSDSIIFTEQQLSDIEKYASIYLKISDIAVILDIAPRSAAQRHRTPRQREVSRRYHRGKAISKVKLRQQEMTLAQVGSPLALVNTANNLLDMEDDE